MKDKVIYSLVNREMNAELLENIPYKEYFDYAIIFKIIVSVGSDGLRSTLIKSSMMESLGVCIDELMDAAHRNTQKILPVKFQGMRQLLFFSNIIMKKSLTTQQKQYTLKMLTEQQFSGKGVKY